jgi:hypothetical protein
MTTSSAGQTLHVTGEPETVWGEKLGAEEYPTG